MRTIMKTTPALLALIIGLGAAACDRRMEGTPRDTTPPATADRPAAPADKPPSSAPTETLDVKAALIADKTVDASDINVDTFADTRTVVLKGTVPTEAQKEAAERIAIREAVGYKVNNQLTVRAR